MPAKSWLRHRTGIPVWEAAAAGGFSQVHFFAEVRAFALVPVEARGLTVPPRGQPRRAPRKNSALPSPPAIAEGNILMSVQPWAAAKAAMSSQTRACTAA